MADSVSLAAPLVADLAAGTTIVALTPRNAVDLNDELEIMADGQPVNDLSALVVAIQPAASMEGSGGDAVLLRVFQGDRPVLDDDTFAAHRAAVEAQWR